VSIPQNLQKKKGLSIVPEKTGAIFGVFDGHCGSLCSDFVSRRLPRILYENENFPNDIPKSLTESFLETDKLWLKNAKLKKLEDGSTGIVVYIQDDFLYVANAGDSRGIMCDNDKLVELSKDHKPKNEDEKARIEKYGGKVSKGRINGNLAVSRGFGDLSFKNQETFGEKFVSAEPEVRVFKITDQTSFFILACDGLWDTVTNEQAVEFVKQQLAENAKKIDELSTSDNRDLYEICVDLVNLAFKQKSRDNISCVLVVFNHKKV